MAGPAPELRPGGGGGGEWLDRLSSGVGGGERVSGWTA